MSLEVLWSAALVRWMLAGACLLTGCASLPAPAHAPPSRAYPQPHDTPLGRLAAGSAPHPRLSGFRLLVSGEDALGSLMTLADHARHTLDLQYYLIHNDESTREILQRVRAAADRGVRVRFLLDDIHTAGEDDKLLALDDHPNIEVRLFNPFPSGRFSMITRLALSLTDIPRINQRMHSKMFVADNALAITGGRNLGDPYFVRSPTSNFLDLDVVAAGPVVRQLSASFDEFWNHRLAYPVRTLATARPSASDDAAPSLAAPTSESALPHDARLARELERGRLDLVWAPAVILSDKPAKIVSEGDPGREENIAQDVYSLMRSARSELIVISPYYVPGERGMALVRELRSRGVRVRVLTNSLAATDAPVVHIGYARYRKRLVAAGVELHELQPRLAGGRSRIGSFGSSRASLHAKALIIDRHTVLVGSMNMDPRSEKLNTEIGMVVRSRPLAGQLVKLYEDVTLHSSYRIALTGDDEVRWLKEAPEDREAHDSEPEASRGLRLLLFLLTPFAAEEML
ncbi:phospholipase D family protein [Schlegelella sp. S2-27]|uniref:Phospholipase D family protein n=1 Tax=Caldimonas mangrovi TaxID=2944811 RepID=A0ABT0YHS2_9BURK|nr:phospholipase D family protein [Caldimonas mangrovi]MCM5678291.1 phospholipase D family protein [Caldimonas mangrovi]